MPTQTERALPKVLIRLGWRWFTLFVLLYMFFGEDGLNTDLGDRGFPIISPIIKWYDHTLMSMWDNVVPWLGERLLGHPIVVRSLDTVFDYSIVAILLGSALLIAVVWTFLDRHRPRGERLYTVTRVLARYNLAAIMFNYGLLKTFHGQFPYPGPVHLMEPVGDLSPDQLMWVFMGYSTLFDSFAEVAEVIGGILLLFRRTTTLGALLVFGVMTNVFMMNTSYLVLNRIFAGFYMLTAIYLLVPVAQRLMNAILGNEALPALPVTHTWPKPWMKWMSIAIKIVVIGCLFFPPLVRAIDHGKASAVAEKMPWAGVYQVDGARVAWERVAIEGRSADWLVNKPYPYFLAVRTANDDIENYALHVDRVTPSRGYFRLVQCHNYDCAMGQLPRHTLHLALQYVIEGNTPKGAGETAYPAKLLLTGTIRGVPASLRLSRFDTSKYPLVHQPFSILEPDDIGWDD